MIYLWRGFHSLEIREFIDRAWTKGDLLILCPNYIKDFEFILGLPQGPIQLVGGWDELHRKELEAFALKRKFQSYPQYPVLGVFTTGTTSGKPRLVLYSKNNIQSSLEAIRSVFNLEKLDAIFCYPQPSHAFGLILGYLHSYLYGLKLVMGTGRYSKRYHDLWIESEKSKTMTLGTPTHFEDLLSHLNNRKLIASSSYTSIVGGAKCTVAQWEAMQNNLRIEAPSVGYGATEVALGVTHSEPGLKPTEDDEIGSQLPHIQMRNHEGRGVEVLGPSICVATIESGVVHFPKTILLADHLQLRSHDRVYIYKGRFELILNRGGFKFSLEHIENTLFSNLKTQVICVPVPDKRLGEELGIVTIQGQKEKVYDILFKAFGHSFNQENFKLVSEFPVNNNLKVDRQKCAQYFQSAAREY